MELCELHWAAISFFIDTNGFGVNIYDASEVLAPVLLSSISMNPNENVSEILVQGTKLGMVYWINSYHSSQRACAIYEVGNPLNPAIIYSDRSYSLIGDGVNRMILINEGKYQFIDFDQPAIMGGIIFNSAITQIVANDAGAFTYNRGGGISSLNISNPYSPIIKAQMSVPDLNAMCLSGNLLATSQSHRSDEYYTRNEIKLHHVFESGGIQTVSTLPSTGPSYPNWATLEIRIADDKLLLSNGGAGMDVYNISSHVYPTLAFGLREQQAVYVSGILQGDYLYSGGNTLGGGNSINIYDITDISSSILLSTIPVDFTIKRIQLQGSWLFVGGGSPVIKIFDVADPLAPLVYSEIPVSANVQDFLLTNDALTVLHHNSLAVNKISNPLQPVLAGMHPVEGGAICLALLGNYALVGTGKHAALYDCSAAFDICETSVQDQELVPSAFRLSCYPNPFHEKVNISVDLPESGMLALDIYNIRGQKVKSLDPAYYSKGVNIVYCDAQADLSSALPAGIYILKAQSGTYSASIRMVLLK